MNRDEMIENAARAMAADTYATPDAWDVWVKNEGVRHDYRRQARAALEAAGTLPPEREPLPIGTRKRSPEGDEAILADEDDPFPWFVYRLASPLLRWLNDATVANWEVITDTPATNDMRVVQDGPDAQDVVSGAPKATIDAQALAESLYDVFPALRRSAWIEQHARAIREWADEHGHRPPVPEGHVTVGLAWADDETLSNMEREGLTGGASLTEYVAGLTARAELARRGESA